MRFPHRRLPVPRSAIGGCGRIFNLGGSEPLAPPTSCRLRDRKQSRVPKLELPSMRWGATVIHVMPTRRQTERLPLEMQPRFAVTHAR